MNITQWFDGLNEREKEGLKRLRLFDLETVKALVNDENYQFPAGCNMANKSKKVIRDHIDLFLSKYI
jgi:hypothetical protein